jgi:hypothetical protein
MAWEHNGCEINDVVDEQKAKEQNLATGVLMFTKDVRKGITRKLILP